MQETTVLTYISDAVEVSLSKEIIEWSLTTLAPDIKIFASQMTEMGWIICLSGPRLQMEYILEVWKRSSDETAKCK